MKSPPNFLRASALAEHVKPMVVIPDEEELEEPEEDEPEPLIDVSEAQPVMASQPTVLKAETNVHDHIDRVINKTLIVLAHRPFCGLSKNLA